MKQKSWITRLQDSNDNTVSASTVFLIAVSIVAVLLLLVPVVGMMVDIIYNHTITMSMSDMAQYVGAVVLIFTTGGLLKGWTNYSMYRFGKQPTLIEEETETPSE